MEYASFVHQILGLLAEPQLNAMSVRTILHVIPTMVVPPSVVMVSRIVIFQLARLWRGILLFTLLYKNFPDNFPLVSQTFSSTTRMVVQLVILIRLHPMVTNSLSAMENTTQPILQWLVEVENFPLPFPLPVHSPFPLPFHFLSTAFTLVYPLTD